MIGNSHSQDLFNALVQVNSAGTNIDFLRIGINLSCFNEAIPEFANVRENFYQSEQYKAATTIIVSTKYRTAHRCAVRYLVLTMIVVAALYCSLW